MNEIKYSKDLYREMALCVIFFYYEDLLRKGFINERFYTVSTIESYGFSINRIQNEIKTIIGKCGFKWLKLHYLAVRKNELTYSKEPFS